MVMWLENLQIIDKRIANRKGNYYVFDNVVFLDMILYRRICRYFKFIEARNLYYTVLASILVISINWIIFYSRESNKNLFIF